MHRELRRIDDMAFRGRIECFMVGAGAKLQRIVQCKQPEAIMHPITHRFKRPAISDIPNGVQFQS